MPRTIMSEKLEKSAATVKQKNGEDVKNLTPNDEESTIVTAAELKKLFNEWDASNRPKFEVVESKIQKLHLLRPDLNISTEVIVGFPGETEEKFNSLVNTKRF